MRDTTKEGDREQPLQDLVYTNENITKEDMDMITVINNIDNQDGWSINIHFIDKFLVNKKEENEEEKYEENNEDNQNKDHLPEFDKTTPQKEQNKGNNQK